MHSLHPYPALNFKCSFEILRWICEQYEIAAKYSRQSCPLADGGHAAGEEHAQAVLDLALRLLNLWCIVGKPELAIAWGSALASDAAGITPAETSTSDAGALQLQLSSTTCGES